MPLRLQKTNPTRDDAGKFVQLSRNTKNLRDRELIDSILHISITENRELYEKLRKEETEMCEALRELMREDLDAAYHNGMRDAAQSMVSSVTTGMAKHGYGEDDIATITSLLANVAKV